MAQVEFQVEFEAVGIIKPTHMSPGKIVFSFLDLEGNVKAQPRGIPDRDTLTVVFLVHEAGRWRTVNDVVFPHLDLPAGARMIENEAAAEPRERLKRLFTRAAMNSSYWSDSSEFRRILRQEIGEFEFREVLRQISDAGVEGSAQACLALESATLELNGCADLLEPGGLPERLRELLQPLREKRSEFSKIIRRDWNRDEFTEVARSRLGAKDDVEGWEILARYGNPEAKRVAGTQLKKIRAAK